MAMKEPPCTAWALSTLGLAAALLLEQLESISTWFSALAEGLEPAAEKIKLGPELRLTTEGSWRYLLVPDTTSLAQLWAFSKNSVRLVSSPQLLRIPDPLLLGREGWLA